MTLTAGQLISLAFANKQPSMPPPHFFGLHGTVAVFHIQCYAGKALARPENRI
jgi:hypothetical protein